MGRLRVIYRNLMKLDYDNLRTRTNLSPVGGASVEQKDPLELLEEFYRIQNGQPMSEEQRKLAKELMEDIWEGEA